MWNYYLKIAVRNLLRQRAYSLLNIVGLSTGLAVSVLLAVLVWHELRFDAHHPAADRLYRVVQLFKSQGERSANTTALMAPALLQDVPQVEAAGRFMTADALVERPGRDAVRAHEYKLAHADQGFLDLLPYRTVAGKRERQLADPASVLITERIARKYFGDENPVGQTLRLDQKLDLVVTAVVADVQPGSSHLQFDLLTTLDAHRSLNGIAAYDSWWWPPCYTYVRLRPGADPAELNAQVLPAFIAKHREKEVAANVWPQLQPVRDIHLYGENPGQGSYRFVVTLGVVGLFVLLLACVNFANLATARATHRAKEVGLRKTIGARRGQLVLQFLGEAFVLVSSSVVLALGMAELALPAFSNWVDQPLRLPYELPVFWVLLGSLALLVSLVAGSYPALYLSGFRPIAALQNQVRLGRGQLRRALVVTQFVISIGLILGTLVVYRQLSYLQEKQLGYDQSRVLIVPTHWAPDVTQRYQAFRDRLLSTGRFDGVAAANWGPGYGRGMIIPAEVDGKQSVPNVLYVDQPFLETMGMRLREGRGFDKEVATDEREAFVVNEAMLRDIKMAESPLGRDARVYYGEFNKVLYEKKGKVIGVVQDFHVSSLYDGIQPTVITIAEGGGNLGFIFVRIRPGAVQPQVAVLEQEWNAFFPSRPFEYSFADDKLQAAYAEDQRLGNAVALFAGLAILISCLGLFGLASYSIEQRTREIGIRKILGASMQNIVVLLTREFVLLVVLAAAIALPLAAWGMTRWLERFSYHTDLRFDLYLLAGLSALGIAAATILYHAVQAARRNPVNAIRSN